MGMFAVNALSFHSNLCFGHDGKGIGLVLPCHIRRGTVYGSKSPGPKASTHGKCMVVSKKYTQSYMPNFLCQNK